MSISDRPMPHRPATLSRVRDRYCQFAAIVRDFSEYASSCKGSRLLLSDSNGCILLGRMAQGVPADRARAENFPTSAGDQ